jgi:hypothetical protein
MKYPGYAVFLIHCLNLGKIPGDLEGMSGNPYDRRQVSDLEHFFKTDMERGKGDDNDESREPFSQA